MKKVFALMAIAAMFAVACSKDDDDKKTDEPIDDPTPTDTYTGPVEGTSEWSVVGTLLESNWGSGAHADYVCAESNGAFVLKNVKLVKNDQIKFRKDKLWEVNRGINEPDAAAELVAGTPTKALQNGGNIIIPADGIFDLYYFEAKEAIVYVQKDATLPEIPDFSEPAPGPQPTAARITIDGDFSDWAAIDPKYVKAAQNDPDSPWEAVKEIRVYADPETVYYYINYDKETLDEQMELKDELPIRLCINTDGEFESGYTNYFLDGYDFIIEGGLASDGAWTVFDGTMHQRIGSWQELLAPGNGLVTGQGNGTEYEIALNRAKFNEAANTSDVPMPMGDTFQTGIRFYGNNWGELSNMPNSSIEEEMGNGWGYLLRITTITE